DAKAGAVMVFLGLGLTDLLSDANTLIHAHRVSTYGAVASVAFWVAIGAALLVVGLVAVAVFPFTGSSGDSLIFFKDVAAQYKGGCGDDKDKFAAALARYETDISNFGDAELER